MVDRSVQRKGLCSAEINTRQSTTPVDSIAASTGGTDTERRLATVRSVDDVQPSTDRPNAANRRAIGIVARSEAVKVKSVVFIRPS